jgi:Ca-activated chloride channel family protein
MNWKRPLAAAAICAGLSAGLTGCETGMDNRASVARSTGPSTTGRLTYSSQSEPSVTFGGERYAELPYQGFQQVAAQPLSTFSVDVDTAAYSHVRRILKSRRMPPRDAVRIEEMVNYFDYSYPRPLNREEPFAITTTVLPNPWNAETRLLHVGLQGYTVPRQARPPVNLVFLIDVSGSMKGADRLDLAKRSLKGMMKGLNADDRIAIVTFADGSKTVLEPTSLTERAEIGSAINRLQAGGGTGGEKGLLHAYSVAGHQFRAEAVNRVILISDGDFNLGASDPASMRKLITKKRRSGIYLSVLTVGNGNTNDHIAQALAQAGNGQAAHLDSLTEARKVLDDEVTANLIPIADDVKIQVEFNPAVVASYRLIGYETRALRNRDFRNDRVDAGDVGSGHSVTALYEITLVRHLARAAQGFRYQPAKADGAGSADVDANLTTGRQGEYAFVKLRYKEPGSSSSHRLDRPVSQEDEVALVKEAPEDLRFALAVAAFGQILRGEIDARDFGYDDVLELARSGRSGDPLGRRGEFIQLVRQAEGISGGW